MCGGDDLPRFTRARDEASATADADDSTLCGIERRSHVRRVTGNSNLIDLCGDVRDLISQGFRLRLDIVRCVWRFNQTASYRLLAEDSVRQLLRQAQHHSLESFGLVAHQ